MISHADDKALLRAPFRDRIDFARIVRPSFGPLAALAITSVALASSAIRVVASSIATFDTPPIPRLVSPARPVRPLPVITPTPELPPALVAAQTPATRPVSNTKPATKSADSSTKPAKPVPATPSKSAQTPPKPEPLPPTPASDAKRIMVRDRRGHVVVTRVHGTGKGDQVAVLLPDGSIGWPDGLTYTEKPFVPATKAEMKAALQSEFNDFQTIDTKHYIVAFQGTRPFAQNSAQMLENLYAKVSDVLNKRGVPVHEAEFPLVAVIFHTEDDFRRHKRVAPDVQAYYDILSNRIFLYEKSKRDQMAPEVSALEKPQTVAHEGTHQVLQNIGVHPRLANWPLWLVEGLAEYCATPKIAKSGVPVWDGLGQPNLLHLATIRDLSDPLAVMVRGNGAARIERDLSKTLVEYLVTRSELTPTDYALAWALTYHLARTRSDEFLDFVREMSALKPLEERTPDQHLKSFRAAFGENLVKIEAAVSKDLRKLRQIDALPYYAVFFEQQLGGSFIRRAMVSQSPSVIRQWIENSTAPAGGIPHWQISEHPSRARATLAVDQWVGGG